MGLKLPHKEGFKVVRVGELVKLVHLTELANSSSYPLLNHNDQVASDIFKQIVSAENCSLDEHSMDVADLVKLTFHKKGIDDLLEEEQRSCSNLTIVRKSGILLKCFPLLFDASKGPITVTEGYSFWEISDDLILPQYLIMELCKQYVSEQPEGIIYGDSTNNYEDFRNLLIYIPEGDSEYSLYEQQRLFNNHRSKELEKITAALNMGIGVNGAIAARTLLQNGRFVIDEFLSNGGFGKVYKAHTIRKKEIVAIKELFVKNYCSREAFGSTITVPELAQKSFNRQQRKFLCEYSILRKLGDITKYVPKTIGTPFNENNTYYYVMEYIQGGTLWEKSKEGNLSNDQIVNIVCQAGIALHYAHNLDYLHLDVSPLNVMIDDEGNGILIDFGSNKHYSDIDKRITSVGQVAKTKPFAAPELLQPYVKQYYMQSDVYSLAATLYTAITQDIPFAHTLTNDTEFTNTIKVNLAASNVPEELIIPILKALSFEISDRYPNILEFLRSLPQSIITGEVKDEISALSLVTGFRFLNHVVDNKEEYDVDYMPDYTSDNYSE